MACSQARRWRGWRPRQLGRRRAEPRRRASPSLRHGRSEVVSIAQYVDYGFGVEIGFGGSVPSSLPLNSKPSNQTPNPKLHTPNTKPLNQQPSSIETMVRKRCPGGRSKGSAAHYVPIILNHDKKSEPLNPSASSPGEQSGGGGREGDRRAARRPGPGPPRGLPPNRENVYPLHLNLECKP